LFSFLWEISLRTQETYYHKKDFFVQTNEKSGLDQLALLRDLRSIAFPYGIGRGLAGGAPDKDIVRTFGGSALEPVLDI
jgi:hypothetical protein